MVRAFILLSFLLSAGLSFAVEMTLKSKDGIEKTFDVVGVSSNNIYYMKGTKALPIPFDMLDKNCLIRYPILSKFRKKSQDLTITCLKGSRSSNYDKLPVSRHVQKVGNSYMELPSLHAIGGGTLSVSNYTDEEYAKIKNKRIRVSGVIIDIYEWGGAAIGPKGEAFGKVVLNLPPGKYKKGDKVYVTTQPVRYKSYYLCVQNQTFDEAVQNIFLPIVE